MLTNVRRDETGFLFRSFNLVPILTASEDVAPIAELTDHGGHAQAHVADVLVDAGITGRVDHFPGQLSCGE